ADRAGVDLGRLVLLARADRQLDPRLAHDDRVAALELGLVDLLPVDEGPLRRAEVDDAHVTGAVDLDDRVHAAHRLVVELEVRRGHLAELDDREAQPLLADELIALEGAEGERCFCAGHEVLPVERLLRDGRGRQRAVVERTPTTALDRYRSSADLMISGMKFVRILISDVCFAKSRASTVEPSGWTRSTSIERQSV